MDPNIAAWMIAGGPRLDAERTWREREQLHALLESRRDPETRLLDRAARLVRPAPRLSEPSCCPA